MNPPGQPPVHVQIVPGLHLTQPWITWLQAFWRAALPNLPASLSAVQAGIVATGTSQATAVALLALVNTITTTPSGTGVVLPAALTAGETVQVFNRGANALAVYPFSGSAIESGAANASVSIAAGSSARFMLETYTQWRQSP